MHPYHVAICEDEAPQAELLAQWVREWAMQEKRPLALSVHPSAEAFLFAQGEAPACDLLLLDIQMPGKSGIELARELRQARADMGIIFVTGLKEHMQEGFDVSALHYLIKPVQREKLLECLTRAVSSVRETAVLIKCKEGIARVLPSHIRYVESFSHEVSIHTGDKCFISTQSIGACWDQLPPELFVRPHRSYIVGLRHIHAIQRQELVLDDSTRLPISRRQYDALNRAFIRFYARGGET